MPSPIRSHPPSPVPNNEPVQGSVNAAQSRGNTPPLADSKRSRSPEEEDATRQRAKAARERALGRMQQAQTAFAGSSTAAALQQSADSIASDPASQERLQALAAQGNLKLSAEIERQIQVIMSRPLPPEPSGAEENADVLLWNRNEAINRRDSSISRIRSQALMQEARSRLDGLPNPITNKEGCDALCEYLEVAAKNRSDESGSFPDHLTLESLLKELNDMKGRLSGPAQGSINNAGVAALQPVIAPPQIPADLPPQRPPQIAQTLPQFGFSMADIVRIAAHPSGN